MSTMQVITITYMLAFYVPTENELIQWAWVEDEASRSPAFSNVMFSRFTSFVLTVSPTPYTVLDSVTCFDLFLTCPCSFYAHSKHRHFGYLRQEENHTVNSLPLSCFPVVLRMGSRALRIEGRELYLWAISRVPFYLNIFETSPH